MVVRAIATMEVLLIVGIMEETSNLKVMKI